MSFARRWLTTFSVVLGLCVAGWWLYLQFLPEHDTSANYVFNLVYAVPMLCASLFLWSRAQLWRAQGHADADGMRLFSLSAAAQFIAQAIWTTQNFFGDAEPVVSWPDIFYVLSLLLSIAALVSLMYHGTHKNPLARISGTIVGTTLAVIVAIVGGMATSGMVIPGSSLVSLDTFYVSMAFVLAALILFALSRGRHAELRPFLIVSLVCVVITGFGDVLYAFDSLAGTYWNGGSADGLYAFAFVLYFWACTRVLPDGFPSAPHAEIDEQGVLHRSYVYVPVGILLLGILLSSHAAEWSYGTGVAALQARLTMETATTGELLRQQFIQERSDVGAFAAFFAGSTQVTQAQFDTYANTIFSAHGTTADYAFVDATGQRVYTTQRVSTEQPTQVDATWEADLLQAKTDASLVVSPPTIFPSGQPGVRLTAPVFHSDSYIGSVVSTVRLHELLFPVIATFDRTQYTYEISSGGRLIDANGRTLRYTDGRSVALGDPEEDAYALVIETGTDTSLATEQSVRISVADRQWIVTVRPVDDALQSITTATLLLFLGLLLLCSAAAIIAYSLLSTHVRMKRDLQEKTQSLRTKITELSQTKYFLDHVSEAVVIADEQWRIVYANRAASQLSIHPDHALVGKLFWTHILTKLDAQRTGVQEALEQFGSFEGELQVIARGGGSRDHWLTVQPLPADAGLPHASIILLRDITERKTVERAKSAFVSLVAHQLRTPMTQLRWMVETLLSGRLTKTVRATLEQVQEIVLKENQLVSDLLNVSRIERGVLKLSSESVTVSALLHETIEPLKVVAEHRTVRILLPENIPAVAVQVDAAKMVEAIRNLVDNAVKYTPESGEVVIGAVVKGSHVEISIADHGAGVPEEIWDTLFDIKYTPTLNATQNSTGLGLYLTKRFVEAMGGTIRFTSTSAGAIFVVSLPCIAA